MGYGFLVAALRLNATANILLKMAALRIGPWSGGGALFRLATNYHLMAVLLLVVLSTAFYVAALTRLSLSIAYPVMGSGGIAIIASISILYLGERITLPHLAGFVLLAAGTTLIIHQPLT
jgi:small multidrug resistance pump